MDLRLAVETFWTIKVLLYSIYSAAIFTRMIVVVKNVKILGIIGTFDWFLFFEDIIINGSGTSTTVFTKNVANFM